MTAQFIFLMNRNKVFEKYFVVNTFKELEKFDFRCYYIIYNNKMDGFKPLNLYIGEKE